MELFLVYVSFCIFMLWGNWYLEYLVNWIFRSKLVFFIMMDRCLIYICGMMVIKF